MFGIKEKRDKIFIPEDCTAEERLELMIKQFNIDSKAKIGKVKRRSEGVDEKEYKKEVNQKRLHKKVI